MRGFGFMQGLMSIKQHWLIGLSWVFLMVSPALAMQAQAAPNCVVVTGSASTETVSESFARQMAIRNALKLASMQSNLDVSSEQVVTDHALTKDTTYFTSNSKVAQFHIVKEGFKPLPFEERFDEQGQEIKDAKSDIYEVTLQACLTEDPKACDNLLGNHLQPKLAIAQVVTTDSYGAKDISNLLTGYQLELERRLKNLNYRNLFMLENGGALQQNQTVAPNLDPEILKPIRESSGAQYLLLTVLRSTAAYNEDAKLWNDIKRFYNREVHPNRRYIEADEYVVDLINYQVVHQVRNGFNVKGEVTVGRDRPFGTSAFFATDTGTAYHALLQTQVESVYDFLKCKTIESDIIDIRDKDYIVYLSADSGARVGDTFAVYHKFGRPVRYMGADLGTDTEPAGFLKIKRIQSKFAVAELVAEDGRIEIGDVVRTW